MQEWADKSKGHSSSFLGARVQVTVSPFPQDVAINEQHELRQWFGNVTLVKVKSHTGCLLNERVDELAKLGKEQVELPEICPGPQQDGSFWLLVRPATRDFAEKCTNL